jgi:hypothetical protein
MLNLNCATQCNLAGIAAMAIGTGQNLSDRYSVRTKSLSDALGLFHTVERFTSAAQLPGSDPYGRSQFR